MRWVGWFTGGPVSIQMAPVTITTSGTSMILPRHPDYRKNSEEWPDPQPKAIGYWHSEAQPYLPHPQDFIAEGWDGPERDAVLHHLEHRFEIEHQWFGPSRCRLCFDEDNGCLCLTDGFYVWPEGFAHYVRDHGVKPPKEFIQHVLSY